MKKRTTDKRVSDATRKLMKDHNYAPTYRPNEKKYYRKQALMNMDYNLLEHQYPVRKYFHKKFGINLQELEILLYLFPKGYFSWADYKSYPLNFTYRQITSMIKKGHIQVYLDAESTRKRVYTLTKQSKFRIQVYYKLLSGELQVPVCSENNPMIRKDATPHEKKIIKLFHKMRKENEEKKG